MKITSKHSCLELTLYISAIVFDFSISHIDSKSLSRYFFIIANSFSAFSSLPNISHERYTFL